MPLRARPRRGCRTTPPQVMVASLTVASLMVAPLMVAPLMVAPGLARAKACRQAPLNPRRVRRCPTFTPLRWRSPFTPLRCRRSFTPLRRRPAFTPLRRRTAFTPLRRAPAFTSLRRRIRRNLDGRIRLAGGRDPWHLRAAAKGRVSRRFMRVLWVAAAAAAAFTAVFTLAATPAAAGHCCRSVLYGIPQGQPSPYYVAEQFSPFYLVNQGPVYSGPAVYADNTAFYPSLPRPIYSVGGYAFVQGYY